MRDLLGTRVSAEFTADSAIRFTLSECSEESERFAATNGITIFASDRIAAMIDAAGIHRFPEILNPAAKHGPKCAAPMVLRTTAKGSFWGCSNYGPLRCRGQIEAEMVWTDDPS